MVSTAVTGALRDACSVLALTALLRTFPLHVAYPVSQGLAILAVVMDRRRKWQTRSTASAT